MWIYGNYFVAMGAALSDETEVIDAQRLEQCIARRPSRRQPARRARRTSCSSRTQADYEAFKARHDRDKVPRGDFAELRGACICRHRCGLHDDEDRRRRQR
jgi:activator of 2-hydroxyglutaryl-CoA dehydratase